MIVELNKEDYAAAKVAVTDNIRALREDATLWVAIDATDKKIGGTRLRDYFEDCIEHPGAHNLYELLALPRFARLVATYIYLPEMAVRPMRFFEALPQPSAKGRTTVELSPAQVFQLASIYGFYRANGKRLTREALLFVPRKFGKTTTVAGVAFYDILFGDADAEVYISANSLAQSTICFNMIRRIVKKLNSRKVFREVADTIEVFLPDRECKIQCFADSPRSLDGLKASLCVNDESSQAVSYATKNTLTTSMGPRENPLTIDITTASDLIEGPFVDQLNYFKSILRGEVENDSVFAHIFQPDLGDVESDPATWRKVNPHIGVTVDADFYASEYDKAQRSHENMVAFRTKLLNVFVCGTTKSWITSDEVWRRFRDWNIAKHSIYDKMLYATCSFDLSIRDDFSCVTYLVRLPDEHAMHSHTDYYLPRATLARHANSELYRKWAAEGHLKIIEGEVIDYNVIAQDILSRNQQVALTAIGYDAYRNAEVVNVLRNAGAAQILKAIPQVRSAFTAPTDIMELAIAKKKITFSPNPITAWCFENAVVDEDNNGNRKPMKKYHASPNKIDGVITNLMCIKLWNEREQQVL